MLDKLGRFIIAVANQENNKQASFNKRKRQLCDCEINVNYLDTKCMELFELRHHENLSQRIKFKI